MIDHGDEAVARHYSRNLDWFLSDTEEDQADRTGLGISLGRAVRLGTDLQAVELSAPPARVEQWVVSSRWWDYHWSYELDAREILGPWGMLTDLTTRSLREGGATAAERPCWPGAWPSERPSCHDIVSQGMVTRKWISYLLSLVSSFSQFADDARRLVEDVGTARCLLIRLFLLCSDLPYVCRVHEYAWFLYRPTGMPHELVNPELVLAVMERDPDLGLREIVERELRRLRDGGHYV